MRTAKGPVGVLVTWADVAVSDGKTKNKIKNLEPCKRGVHLVTFIRGLKIVGDGWGYCSTV